MLGSLKGELAMQTVTLRVNGRDHDVALDDGDMPLLYVLRGELALTATRFGCGLGQCGACTVIIDGKATRSCITPAAGLVGHDIVTAEGIGSPAAPHPVQAAFIAEQAAQCGYCSNGMVMSAVALLKAVPHPSEALVRRALAGNLCRCGTYPRVLRAVMRAAGGGA
jgi:nicotinate dehydrogenase subunit A